MHELQGRIPYVGDGRTLVSGKTYNRLARMLRELYSESLDIGVGPTGGLRLETRFSPSGGGSGGGGGGGGGYSGPFAVSYGSSRITVADGLVIAGATTISVSATTVSSGNGTVYLALSYSGGSYSYSVARGSPPSQGATTAVYRLATIAGGAVTQVQYGDIYVAGRVV